MKNIITLFAVIMVTIYLAKLILRLCGAIGKLIPINEPEAALTLQEELK